MSNCPFCMRGHGTGCALFERREKEGTLPPPEARANKQNYVCLWARFGYRDNISELEVAMYKVKLEDEAT
ncbi:MAG: hypothetical protein L0Z53_06625 [Acidobacteriales bacterium]|nr:hypothetical protein [Terriglobales bacterium]